ncbi:MAG: fibronectin-binding domain-containing protein, partial [Archaeoglobaceae archaeon]
ETAEFAAIYSSLWKEGKHSGEVYYVKPEQVLRSAKSGEYLPKGSFYIVGERNYITVELRCAIGVELEKMRVIGGPVSAVKKWADYYVELEIGDVKSDELSVEIAKILAEKAGENAYIVKAIARPEEIAKFLPPGKSRIVV